jgi:hypothetical protein
MGFTLESDRLPAGETVACKIADDNVCYRRGADGAAPQPD